MGLSAVEVNHKQTFEDDGPDQQPGHVTRFIAARNHASELTVIQDEATACFDVSIPAHLAFGHYPVSHGPWTSHGELASTTVIRADAALTSSSNVV